MYFSVAKRGYVGFGTMNWYNLTLWTKVVLPVTKREKFSYKSKYQINFSLFEIYKLTLTS